MSKLYNEERKRRYINKKESEVTLSPNFLDNLFSKAGMVRRKNGQKDPCEWTLSEILSFYKFADVYSLESLALMNSNYSMYVNWCISETLVPDGQNHYHEVTVLQTMLECVNTFLLDQTIITAEEFHTHVDTIPNYTDRFVFYALFEGMSGEWFQEITRAKLSDINDGRIHLCTGREFDVSARFIEIAQRAAAEESYQSYGERSQVFPYRKGRDTPEDLLFKITRVRGRKDGSELKNDAQVLLRRYTRCLNYVGFPRQMTCKRLAMSGKLNYMKEIMVRENLTVEQVIRLHREEIDYRYPVEKLKSMSLFMKKYGKHFEIDNHQEKDQSRLL